MEAFKDITTIFPTTEGVLKLLDLMFTDLILRHPLPWTKKETWSQVIRDGNGECVIFNTHTSQMADKMIELAELRIKTMKEEGRAVDKEFKKPEGDTFKKFFEEFGKPQELTVEPTDIARSKILTPIPDVTIR